MMNSMFSFDKQKEAYLDMYQGIGQDVDKYLDQTRKHASIQKEAKNLYEARDKVIKRDFYASLEKKDNTKDYMTII